MAIADDKIKGMGVCNLGGKCCQRDLLPCSKRTSIPSQLQDLTIFLSQIHLKFNNL